MKLDNHVRAAIYSQSWRLRTGTLRAQPKFRNITTAACKGSHHSDARSRQGAFRSKESRNRLFTTMSKLPSWWEPPEPAEPTDKLESKQMDIGQLPAEGEELLTRRIHILGAGSIGTLTAHSLKILPNPPPVTLLLHRQDMLNDFKRQLGVVRLINKDTEIVDDQTGYDVDVASTSDDGPAWIYHPHLNAQQEPSFPLTEGELMDSGEVFIYSLIVSVKATATVAALQSVKHRIDSRTTIVLMQNGMGQIDELNQHVFTDPATRPSYMLAIVIHGAHMAGRFQVVHAGRGSVAVGVHRDTDRFPLPPKGKDLASLNLPAAERRKMFPTDEDLYYNLSARYLLRTLTRSTALACAPYPYLDLLQLQLEKLATNCVINPLTTVLDVQNGAILEGVPVTRLKRLLLAEISLVMRSLPELAGVPNVPVRFSPAKLEERTDHLASVTAKNSSSMREDMRHVKYTEIDFINGYIVKRGDEQGIKCVLNYMIMQLVKAQHQIKGDTMQTSIPRGMVDVQGEQQGSVVMLEDKST